MSTTTSLWHISGWDELAHAVPGMSFVLRPGPQGAEGSGVYFSEGRARPTAAEGARGCPTAAVVIDGGDARGWWRSKGAKACKFGKPRTWHTAGMSLRVTVEAIERGPDPWPVLRCSWSVA